MKKTLTTLIIFAILTASVGIANAQSIEISQASYQSLLQNVLALLVQEVSQLEAQLAALQASNISIATSTQSVSSTAPNYTLPQAVIQSQTLAPQASQTNVQQVAVSAAPVQPIQPVQLTTSQISIINTSHPSDCPDVSDSLSQSQISADYLSGTISSSTYPNLMSWNEFLTENPVTYDSPGNAYGNIGSVYVLQGNFTAIYCDILSMPAVTLTKNALSENVAANSTYVSVGAKSVTVMATLDNKNSLSFVVPTDDVEVIYTLQLTGRSTNYTVSPFNILANDYPNDAQITCIFGGSSTCTLPANYQ